MSLEFEHVTDAAGAADYHEIDVTATPVDHPGLVADPLDDILGMLANPLPSFHVAFFVGRDGHDVVANGFLGLPQVENTRSAHVHVVVAPAVRRRGHGLQAAQLLLDKVRGADRGLVLFHTGAPLDATSPGNEMAARLGATAALVSTRRELVLGELDRGELASRLRDLLDGPCAPYELRSWTGPCPADLVDGAAGILPLVMSDSPRGELDLEDEVWDVARYREYESMLVARQRNWIVTSAMERSSGQMVAMTDLNVPNTEHRVVTQQGTVVEPTHRGHRLGLAVKIANALRLIEAYPDAETIQTHNAGENEHMIKVNEALGFRAAERSTAWKLEL